MDNARIRQGIVYTGKRPIIDLKRPFSWDEHTYTHKATLEELRTGIHEEWYFRYRGTPHIAPYSKRIGRMHTLIGLSVYQLKSEQHFSKREAILKSKLMFDMCNNLGKEQIQYYEANNYMYAALKVMFKRNKLKAVMTDGVELRKRNKGHYQNISYSHVLVKEYKSIPDYVLALLNEYGEVPLRCLPSKVLANVPFSCTKFEADAVMEDVVTLSATNWASAAYSAAYISETHGIRQILGSCMFLPNTAFVKNFKNFQI